MLWFRIVLLMSAVSIVFTACGCDSEPSYKLTPATAIVKIGGKPAQDISIQFMPNVLKDAAGPTSVGQTNAEGKAVLTTIDGREGAVVGNHMVVLCDMTEERPAQGSRKIVKPRINSKLVIPSPMFTFDVKEGSTEPIVIDLPVER